MASRATQLRRQCRSGQSRTSWSSTTSSSSSWATRRRLATWATTSSSGWWAPPPRLRLLRAWRVAARQPCLRRRYPSLSLHLHPHPLPLRPLGVCARPTWVPVSYFPFFQLRSRPSTSPASRAMGSTATQMVWSRGRATARSRTGCRRSRRQRTWRRGLASRLHGRAGRRVTTATSA